MAIQIPSKLFGYNLSGIMSKKKKLPMKFVFERRVILPKISARTKVVNLFVYSLPLARSKHTSQCNELLDDTWAAAEHFPLPEKQTRLLHL